MKRATDHKATSMFPQSKELAVPDRVRRTEAKPAAVAVPTLQGNILFDTSPQSRRVLFSSARRFASSGSVRLWKCSCPLNKCKPKSARSD